MNIHLEQQLFFKYEKLFSNDRNTFWGFKCDDGWYNIIDVLCENFQKHIDFKRGMRLLALLLNRRIRTAFTLNSIKPLKKDKNYFRTLCDKHQ